MSERLLVTQALDERDLLVKKITDKINKANFNDFKRHNETNGFITKLSEEDFSKDIESTYQSIMDLIARYQKIDAAIIKSNADTTIQTSYGTFTVAGAISLRNRLRTGDYMDSNCDFESLLSSKMERDYNNSIRSIDTKNRELQNTAAEMRLSILGKDTKVKDDKPLEVVDTYVKENTNEIIDPLNVQKKIKEFKEKHETLLTELDTQIKVSNATTFIEI